MCQYTENFQKWFHVDQKKIILQEKEKELIKLIDNGFFYIRDKGLTEIKGTLHWTSSSEVFRSKTIF